MNIVYATDDNGALGTGVSIVSLMENLPPGVHADIYIMTGGLSGDNTARFHSLQQGYNLHLHFIDMKDKYTDFPVGSKWSEATYYRLGLAGELPATVERALYVDIDTIFNRDISPMYESEFGDCLIAGVFTTEDLSEESFSRWKREMNLDRSSIYINAGVILYHIGRIREECFESQVLSWAKNQYSPPFLAGSGYFECMLSAAYLVASPHVEHLRRGYLVHSLGRREKLQK